MSLTYHTASVLFFQNDIVGNDTISTILSRTEIWDRNYINVPDQYWKPSSGTSGFSAEVAVYNSNHLIAGDDDAVFTPVGGMGTEMCSWTCESSNYAYRIKAVQWQGMNYTQSHAWSYVDEAGYTIPYYRWFSESEFNSYIGLQNGGNGTGEPLYHGFAQWPEFEDGSNTTTANGMIRLTNSTSSNFCDSNGGEITSNLVYGIRKHYWIWYADQYAFYGGATNFCVDGASTLSSMIDFLNIADYDPSRPALHCYPNLASGCGVGGGTEGNPDDQEDGPATQTCGVVYNFSNPILFLTSEFVCESYEDGEYELNPPGQFFLNTELFNITNMTRNPEVVLSGSGTDFVDEYGTPSISPVLLAPGLYKTTVKLKNERLQYSLKEIQETVTISIAHKDFFDALVYPNPNTEEYYFIDILSAAHLKPVYEVFDGVGTKIWEQHFDLPLGHDESHRIQPQSNFPNGFILHKFTFQDGSSKTYTTLKQ